MAIFMCLIMPIVGYHYFNFNNKLARTWRLYMRVSSEDYYSFMFPATIALIIGLKIPIFFARQIHQKEVLYMDSAKLYGGKMKWQGLIMVIIGIIASLLKSYSPGAISHIFFLLSYLMFVGVFYCLYSQFPNKKTILTVVFSILIIRSILGGMFGEMVFMGTMTVILVLLGKKIKFITKFSVLLAGISIILIIQVVKPL